jgi:hypothetical protein
MFIFTLLPHYFDLSRVNSGVKYITVLNALCIESWFRTVSLHIRSDALIAVAVKSAVFLDIKPCSPLKANRCFRGKYRSVFSFDGKAEQQTSVVCRLLSRWFLSRRILRP